MQDQLESEIHPYRLHKRLGYQLSRLSKITQQRLEEELAAHGMTRLKWCVMSSIAWEQICTPSELATHIGINRPAVSRVLVQLRQENLITQSFSESDGRSRQIQLTEQGFEMLRLCRPMVDQVESFFLGKLSSKDIAIFQRLIGVLLEGEQVLVDKL